MYLFPPFTRLHAVARGRLTTRLSETVKIFDTFLALILLLCIQPYIIKITILVQGKDTYFKEQINDRIITI